MIETNKGKVILIEKNELDFEFIDPAIKSFVKKISTTEDGELIISKNRFTEEMIEKFIDDDIQIREQFQLS